MTGSSVVGARLAPRKQRLILAVVIAGLIICVGVGVGQAHLDHVGALSAVLAVAAVIAGAMVVPSLGRASISAGFVVLTLAAALLGPASAAGYALLHEAVAARKLRTAPSAALYNALASA